MFGLDGCAPHRDQNQSLRTPHWEIISAMKEDYQQVTSLVADLTMRMSKMETFTQCMVDQNKESLRLVEDNFYSRVQDLETQLQGLKGSVEDLMVKASKPSEPNRESPSPPKVSVFNCWQEECKAHEAQLTGTIQLLQPTQKRHNEENTDDHSCWADARYQKELERALVGFKNDCFQGVEEKLKYWRDGMTNQLQICWKATDAASRDAQAVSSRLDSIVKKQRVQVLALITFCLRTSQLERSSITACIKKLEKKEAHLRQEYGFGKADGAIDSDASVVVSPVASRMPSPIASRTPQIADEGVAGGRSPSGSYEGKKVRV